MQVVTTAELTPGRGMAGDHFRPGRRSAREVTLIQHEHLAEIAEQHAGVRVEPELLRRNLVVSGIELKSLIGRRFRVGTVVLEGTGPCTPCLRMDEALGAGGRLAMRGRGGLIAKIVQGGTISVGDIVGLAESVC